MEKTLWMAKRAARFQKMRLHDLSLSANGLFTDNDHVIDHAYIYFFVYFQF